MNLTYAGIMAAAIATGAFLGRRTQSALRLPWTDRLGIGFGAFCGAMIAAKLPFVLTDWEGLRSGAAWLADGKTILCGLVGGYFGVEIAKWALEIRVKTGDSFAAPVAAAVAIGRLACFYGGCCYGATTSLPWAVVFPHVDDRPRHPTQLYEFLFHYAAAIALLAMQQQGLLRGQLIKLYLLAYLAYRFATEFIRPEPQLLGGLTGYQWAAVAAAPLFVFLWARDRRLMRVASAGPGGA